MSMSATAMQVRTARRPRRRGRRARPASPSPAAATDDGGGDEPKGRKKGEKITLTFWSWVPGIDKPVDLWNSKNPEVQVKVEKVSAVNGAQYAKMHAAIKAGNPPDLGQIEYPVVPSFLLDNGLLDLAEYGDRPATRTSSSAGSGSSRVFGKGVYADPAGVRADGAVPTARTSSRSGASSRRPTWDEYEAAAKAIRKKGAWIETFSPTNGNRFARPRLAGRGAVVRRRGRHLDRRTSTTSRPARSPTTGTRWSSRS